MAKKPFVQLRKNIKSIKNRFLNLEKHQVAKKSFVKLWMNIKLLKYQVTKKKTHRPWLVPEFRNHTPWQLFKNPVRPLLAY